MEENKFTIIDLIIMVIVIPLLGLSVFYFIKAIKILTIDAPRYEYQYVDIDNNNGVSNDCYDLICEIDNKKILVKEWEQVFIKNCEVE